MEDYYGHNVKTMKRVEMLFSEDFCLISYFFPLNLAAKVRILTFISE